MPTYLKNMPVLVKMPKKRNKLLSVLFAFILLLMFFLLIINVSDIISSLITNKSSLFYTKKMEIPSYTIYAVSLKDFDNEENAQNFAFSLKRQGGAGMVYAHGEFYVLASAYMSLIEAQEVKQSLIDSGFDAKILNLNVLGICKLYNGADLKKYEDSISFFRNCFKDLYEISVDFDKNNKTKNQVTSFVAKQITLCQEYISLISKVDEQKYNQMKNLIISQLTEAKIVLNELLLCDSEMLEYSSKIKETYIKIVNINATLNKNLADN